APSTQYQYSLLHHIPPSCGRAMFVASLLSNTQTNDRKNEAALPGAGPLSAGCVNERSSRDRAGGAESQSIELLESQSELLRDSALGSQQCLQCVLELRLRGEV
ncbi:hypothetical protein KUCAC02_020702, partial [Chaenocephalus aceratus]